MYMQASSVSGSLLFKKKIIKAENHLLPIDARCGSFFIDFQYICDVECVVNWLDCE